MIFIKGFDNLLQMLNYKNGVLYVFFFKIIFLVNNVVESQKCSILIFYDKSYYFKLLLFYTFIISGF